MERAVSSAGWLAAGLLHIFQFATEASARTAPFRAVTSAGTSGAVLFICPNNKVLHTTGTVHDGNMLRHRGSKFDCDACAPCCPNMAARQVPRDVHEDARDMARRLMGTKRFLQIAGRTQARCALLISRPTTVSNGCGSEGSPVRATNFISRPSYRT